MRILRLFVTNHLEIPVNWIIYEDDGNTESGTSTWDELSVIEDVHLEIYLDAYCCSILHTNVAGIATKRLSEELILGMLEESIVDDIEEVKPIVLRIEDDTAYIAIFNKMFYESLLAKITDISKPIRFLQSFVYSTVFNDGEWTLFLNDDQQFLRTSKYEYFLLDNNEPLPLVLQEMLYSNDRPQTIKVYSKNSELAKLITKEYKISCEIQTHLDFGIPIWNFYNQKSTQFKIKLDNTTRTTLLSLLDTVKKFSIVMIVFWLINITMVSCSISSSESKIKQGLATVYPITNFTPDTMKQITNKIDELKHTKGIYSQTDAIPMFSSFLNIISDVGTNSIVQLDYKNNILNVFLNNNFDTAQFTSYKNILSTQSIQASIQSYKMYLSKQKNNQSSNNNPDADMASTQQIDAAWVITLQPLLTTRLQEKS